MKLNKRKITVITIIITILCIVGYFGYKTYEIYLSANKLTTTMKTSRKISFADEPSTILLLGVDGVDSKDAKNEFEKKERSGIQRSDAMILLDFNPDTGIANMTSVMRDIKMPISCDHNVEDKIGHAFSAAYKEGLSKEENSKRGAECVSRTIENKFGVPVDNYVYVNFSGFLKVISKIGGIDINVIGGKPKGTKFCEQDEHGNGGNPDEKTWNVGKYCFRVGEKMHLNKSQSLAYSRHRHMDSDFWRNKRQQQVMKMVAKKLLSPSNIGNLSNVLSSIQGSVKTTLKISDLLSFTKEHSEFLSDIDNSLLIRNNSIKYKNAKENGIYYARFDEDDLKKTLKKIKLNLELEKDENSVPKKLKSLDFDYYKNK